MANQIILKRSSTAAKVPTTGQLELGEIAINTYDGRIFIKKNNGTASVVEIGGVTTVNTYGGAVVLNADDVLEKASSPSNLYFTNARARAALSGTGSISYNSSTGVITTTQSLTTSASPTFAGLTLTGNVGITGNIIPSADITYDLGSAAMQWRDIYVGPGSLYVNGSKVLEDDTGTITFSADMDQNIRIKTLGTGILQLGSSSTNVNVDGTLQIAAGKNITDSAGIKVNFGDNIEMNGNKVIGLGVPSSANDAATKTYVDTAISNISTTSITQGNSNVTVADTGTGTVTVSVDGSTALTVTASGVTVAGNLTVSGATTTVESNTISLADNIITLNSDATGAATQNAGIEVERGDDTNVSIRWDEGSDKWTFTNDGATYLPMAVSTTDLAEGTNLYFTDARARGALSGSSGTGISYSSGTGAFSLGSIPNSSLTNNTVTIGSTSTALGATSTTLAGLTSVTSTGFTGALTGNASTATTLATARTIAMSGDVSWTSLAFDGSGSVSSASTLATVNSNVGTYGSSSAIPVVTVNAKGLVTSVTTSAVSIPSGALTFTGDVTGSGTTGASTALTIANSAVTNAKLANSSVTVTAGTGLSGGGAVSLGGTVTLANTGILSITGTAPVTASTTSGATTISMAAATASVNGYMTSTYAAKLDGIAAGATNVTNNNQLSNGAGYITGITSGNVTTALGFTPYNATNPSGYYSSGSAPSFGATSTGALTVTGAITATGEVTAFYSDINLKKDIVAIEDPIAKVMSLRGVTFRPNATALALGITDKDEVGVIAQEVEAVLPQLVTPSAFEGYKTVKYDKLTALLLEAIKAQQLQLDALTAQIAKLGGSATTEL